MPFRSPPSGAALLTVPVENGSKSLLAIPQEEAPPSPFGVLLPSSISVSGPSGEFLPLTSRFFLQDSNCCKGPEIPFADKGLHRKFSPPSRGLTLQLLSPEKISHFHFLPQFPVRFPPSLKKRHHRAPASFWRRKKEAFHLPCNRHSDALPLTSS